MQNQPKVGFPLRENNSAIMVLFIYFIGIREDHTSTHSWSIFHINSNRGR